MPNPLPGYTYDGRSNRYRSENTGRFVGRTEIVSLLEQQVNDTNRRLTELTTAVHENRIEPAAWMHQMREELRRTHLQNAALGAGGWDRLTQRDFGRVGGRIRGDYAKLAGSMRDLTEGKVSLPQLLNRTNTYVGNARTEYWSARRDRAQALQGDMATIERRKLGQAKHCEDCIEYYEMGWQLLGTLPEPGTDSECGGNCRCTLIERDIPMIDIEQWMGTKR